MAQTFLSVFGRSPKNHRQNACATGFTLIELLAVLVIVGLLLATFVPYAMSLRESSNRVRCTSNLNRIWTAVRDSYMPANGLMWPRVRTDATTNGWTAFTGADDANPFAANSTVAPNDVTASLWLLVREGLAQPDWFVCPSGGGSADRLENASGERTVVKQRGNFRSRENLNYGYATPFSMIADYRLNDTLPARFVLLADQGPPLAQFAGDVTRFDDAAAKIARINSPNHRRAGQNVLYADGTVRFEVSPFCGVGRTDTRSRSDPMAEDLDGDNIFTSLAPNPLIDIQPKHNEPGVAADSSIGPAYRYDTVLVPGANVAHEKGAATPRGAGPAISQNAHEPATRGVAATEPVSETPATTAPTTQP